MNDRPVYVTRPYLPPLEELLPHLREIWEGRVLTNGGPFHQRLEQALAEYLNVKYISLFNNATIALLTSLQAMRVTGDVITTPYSFVATAHSLLWNNLNPVFVDIDRETLNIDPSRIDKAVTKETSAILPVHCYGNPCDVVRIQEIADFYNLRVIYDAAHAFGVAGPGGSILQYGDLSVLSFHATKVFNTFEGGAIVSQSEKMKKHIDHLRNFGFVDEVTVVAAGINGKMSEFNAALGCVQIRHIDAAIRRRRDIEERYRTELRAVKGIRLLNPSDNYSGNHSYFPILINDDYQISRDALYERLRSNGIMARRYFFPLISNIPMYRGFPSADIANLPVANEISARVICLPIYPDLQSADQGRIIRIVAGD
ncbi:DegT/DnrJ/EryC1/StrS family aminotransferase [bacterium]|nr:DegT/DnrJ/EryC1/StrS family aminotransferase [bacterium]